MNSLAFACAGATPPTTHASTELKAPEKIQGRMRPVSARLPLARLTQRIFSYDTYKDTRPEFRRRMPRAYTEGGIAGLERAFEVMKPTLVGHGYDLEKLLYEYDDPNGWLANNARNDRSTSPTSGSCIGNCPVRSECAGSWPKA
jgi:hypothetical protein